jgi:hypothetical protein
MNFVTVPWYHLCDIPTCYKSVNFFLFTLSAHCPMRYEGHFRFGVYPSTSHGYKWTLNFQRRAVVYIARSMGVCTVETLDLFSDPTLSAGIDLVWTLAHICKAFKSNSRLKSIIRKQKAVAHSPFLGWTSFNGPYGRTQGGREKS